MRVVTSTRPSVRAPMRNSHKTDCGTVRAAVRAGLAGDGMPRAHWDRAPPQSRSRPTPAGASYLRRKHWCACLTPYCVVRVRRWRATRSAQAARRPTKQHKLGHRQAQRHGNLPNQRGPAPRSVDLNARTFGAVVQLHPSAAGWGWPRATRCSRCACGPSRHTRPRRPRTPCAPENKFQLHIKVVAGKGGARTGPRAVRERAGLQVGHQQHVAVLQVRRCGELDSAAVGHI